MSVAYYYVVFLPKKELSLIEQKQLIKESKAISELFKIRGLYTGKTDKNKQDTKGTGLDVGTVWRTTIEYLEAKEREEAKLKKQNLAI